MHVPVIKPKKAFTKPTPFQLNPDSQNKRTKFQIFSRNKDSDNNCFDLDNLSIDFSDSSDSEKESKDDIGQFKNDFSTNEKSPIFKSKQEYCEKSF